MNGEIGKNKEQNFVSAVIYVHNAEDRIERFLDMVVEVMERNFEHSEIICVNDSSEDGSLSIVRKVSKAAEKTSISVVNMSYYHGLELAMDAGMDLAIGDFVFEFDNTVADFDSSVIMEIYRHSLEGYDIVSASPNRKERLSSRMFYRIFAKFAAVSYRMNTESFRVLSRRVINRVSSMNKTAPYRKALYANCGLKTDCIRYEVTGDWSKARDRKEQRYRMDLAADALILFTEVGYRFSMTMTVVMMLMSIFMTVYSLVTYFVIHPVEGWTTTILFLSVAFFGLFGILTIIVKYLQLLVDMVFKRKHYSFESIEKLTK
ncbi:MAG: glycosyltransferase [Lachnospiraceae bacterium]|nr:glycosyltransferase [Lachnospiraceae bacterium]